MMPKYGNARDNNEKLIVQALKGSGVSVAYGKTIDLRLGFLGRDYQAEIKNPDTAYGKKGLNENQIEHVATWNGARLLTFYTVEDAQAWVRECREDIAPVREVV